MSRVQIYLLILLAFAILASLLLIFYFDHRSNKNSSPETVSKKETNTKSALEHADDISFLLNGTIRKVEKKGEKIFVDFETTTKKSKVNLNVLVFDKELFPILDLIVSKDPNNLQGEASEDTIIKNSDAAFSQLNEIKDSPAQLFFSLQKTLKDPSKLTCNKELLGYIQGIGNKPSCIPYSIQIAAYVN